MNIPTKKLVPHARIPERAYATDAGFDLSAAESATLQPGERKAVSTGIAIALPEGWVGLVWDKSGKALNAGLHTLAGVIDAGYRGDINVVLMNIGASIIHIAAGERIAQMLFQKIPSVALRETETLPESSRGQNGFGSTDHKRL